MITQLESDLRKELDWKLPIYKISAINNDGCSSLMQALMEQVENHRLQLKESQDYRDQQIEKEKNYWLLKSERKQKDEFLR